MDIENRILSLNKAYKECLSKIIYECFDEGGPKTSLFVIEEIYKMAAALIVSITLSFEGDECFKKEFLEAYYKDIHAMIDMAAQDEVIDSLIPIVKKFIRRADK